MFEALFEKYRTLEQPTATTDNETRKIETVEVTGRWFATAMSDNGNPIMADGESRMRAIIRLHALLREEGFYGTIEADGIRFTPTDN